MNDRGPLDRLLREMPEVEPSATLRRRIHEIPARHPKAAVPRWLELFLGPQAAVLALVLLALGALSGWATTDEEDGTQATTETLAQEAEQWEELSELALATELSEDF